MKRLLREGKKVSVLIKLQFDLFVDYKHIMHLLFKIRISLFAVVPNLEWLDIGFFKNSLDTGLGYC